MQPDRLSILSSAFRGAPITCGPHTLRPVTAGSMMLLMETENPLFTGSEGDIITEADSFQGLFEFIWIHIAPEEEVIEHCADRAILRAKARKLSLSIGFDDISAFSAQFEALRLRLNASLVEIIPEKGSDAAGKPAAAMPSPTGSPPSSTPSADVEIPSASTGSSGGSPSIAPSSTSMPPMPKTDPAPAGKSRIWEQEPEPAEDLENVIPLP